MPVRNLLATLLLLVSGGFAFGQMDCPPNIDFEMGDFTNWNFFTGTCCPGGMASATTPSAALTCRHTLTSAAGLIGCTTPAGTVDPYGGFPVVAPGGGSYSFRLGNSSVGAQAERAQYFVHVPTGVTNYSLVYRYAVVFQNPPSHSADQQPRFVVSAYDSATLAPIPCAMYTYVSTSGLPGFVASACTTCSPMPSTSTPVYYKDWTTTSIDLSGTGGSTVAIDFTSGDCALGGHFGYGYLDMSCGLFAISTSTCDTFTWPTLSAPDGFASYAWYDSATFSILYGTGSSITIPPPSGPLTVAVVLTPYTGFGCPDTLYSRITPAAMALHPSNDTSICRGRSTMLSPGATDIALPLTYSWSPAAGLSCTTCANPVASPTVTTAYTVTVTNTSGCTMDHVFNITVLPDVNTTVTFDTPTCNGFTDGSAVVTATTGTTPYTYTWSTAPVQTTSMATGLSAGTYTVIVFDALGCTDTSTVTLIDPAPRLISITTTVNPSTCLGSDGSITLSGSLQPDSTYVVSYVKDGVPQTQTVTATPASDVTLTGLNSGVYSSITIILAPCVYNVVGPVVLSDPPIPDISGVTSNSFVCEGDTLKLFASSATSGVAFSWDGPSSYVSGLPNPMIVPVTMANAGVYSVTVSKANCFNYATTPVEVRPLPIPTGASSTPVCSGDTLFLSSTSSNGATSYAWTGPDYYTSFVQNPYIAHVGTVSAGVYTVNVTLDGCTVADTVTVVVNETPAPPDVTDMNYCQFDVVSPLEAVGTNLTWYDLATGGVGTMTNPTPSTTQKGVFSWYVTQTSAEGCTSGRSKVSARVWEYPHPRLLMTSDVACTGTYVTFTAENVGEGSEHLTWLFEGNDSVVGENPVYHAYNNVGTFMVSGYIYYNYCPDTVMQRNITVFPLPSVNLGPDTSICPGSNPLQLFADVNTHGDPGRYEWSTGETTQAITVTAPGTYRATITVNGCSSTDSIYVAKDCYISIPNVFTPNGDGLNDFFFPRDMLSRGLTKFSMSIYNRWGQQIFQGNALDGRGWDGRFNGVMQPEGVYVYMIDAVFKDGQQEHHQGNVTLLR